MVLLCLLVPSASQSKPVVSVVVPSRPATPDQQERLVGQHKQPKRSRGGTHLVVASGRTGWLQTKLPAMRAQYGHSVPLKGWAAVTGQTSITAVAGRLQHVAQRLDLLRSRVASTCKSNGWRVCRTAFLTRVSPLIRGDRSLSGMRGQVVCFPENERKQPF